MWESQNIASLFVKDSDKPSTGLIYQFVWARYLKDLKDNQSKGMYIVLIL